MSIIREDVKTSTSCGDVIKSHPSYGKIAIGRRRGSNRGLFGSDIDHSTTITLEISSAELRRAYGEDTVLPKDTIVEVEMTANQFSELLMSVDTTGVPCTIHRRGNDVIEYEPPFEKGKNKLIKEEVAEQMRDIRMLATKITGLLDKVDTKEKLSQATKKELASLCSSLKSQVGSNLDFSLTQVQKEIDNVVSDAVASVEHERQLRLQDIAKYEIANKLSSSQVDSKQLEGTSKNPLEESGTDY